MSGTTTNWGRRYPTNSDSPDVPRDVKNLADDVDNCPPITYGVWASRPTSSPGSPGKQHRFYFATDHGRLYRDTGTGWAPAHVVLTDEVTGDMIAPDAVGSSEIATDAVGSAEIAAGAVKASELDTDAVEEAKIKNGAVSKAKLKTDALNAFLKLATGADLKLAYGTANSGGFGGGNSIGVTVTHGLPSTPILFIAIPAVIATFSPTGTAVVTFGLFGKGSTTCLLQADITEGFSNNAVNFDWIAIY